MPKSFITYEQQIQLLKSKNLTIDDENEAKRQLMKVGYFSLIGGYKHPFKNPTTKKYRDNVSFTDIASLYRFDVELRSLFLKWLLTIERSIKSRIAYVFCDLHGDSQVEYLNPNNYINTPKSNRELMKLINMTLLPLATRPTDYPYINHHQAVYQNVPLWVLVNAISFGNMSHMYNLLPQTLQSKICKVYPLNIKQLSQILKVLTKFRNACAHGERLFSYATKDDIPDLPLHNKLAIPQKGQQYIYGKHDLFSVVIAFRYLLPDEFAEFKKNLSHLIDCFTKECKSLQKSDLLACMGFPVDWERITRYYKL